MPAWNGWWRTRDSASGWRPRWDTAGAGGPVRDHAGGAIRVDKFERETKLLNAGTGILTERKLEKPRLFFCCGQHGSGSTWMFNLVREICRTQAVDFVSCHRESEANLPRDGLGSRLLVVKSHNPMADLQSFIGNSDEPAIITVRDPRDAVVSLMQRFPNSSVTGFDKALKAIALSAQCLVTLSRLRGLPVFRYEDGFVGSVETFDRIAALLGTSPSNDQRTEFLAGLTPEAVKRTISDLEAAGAIRGEAVWDRETHWHANHVGDGKVGKFNSVLSPEQQREIVRQTREFCDCFGYDVTIDETRKSQAPLTAPSGAAPIAAAESRQPVPDQGQATATRQRDAGMKTIGLCMIVKNEAKVIRQCLASALPLVDYVLVVDTGSADGTQQIIRDFLAQHDVRGAVIDEPWRDFAYNRSFALARLREVRDIDYAMIIDADDLVVPDAGFDPRAFKTRMDRDLYDVEIFHGNIGFFRPQICGNRLAFSFKGVLHEYLEAPPGDMSRANASGFRIQTGRGGARSENPRKYQDDAAVLERALTTETDPFLISRYTFYLAQSYKDCGERERALENYLKRAELGYWSEEIYISLLEAGNMMAALDRPFDEVVATYERAAQTVPARAEALYGASLYCRKKGKNAEGQEYARRGIELTPPVGGLFVQGWVYDYGILDEFAINAYWAGAYRESLDASLKLLGGEKLPASMVKRVADNARFATEKLPTANAPNLGTLGAESVIDQHKLVPQRSLRSRVNGSPRVLVAILAKQKEPALPLYLECIEALDYPKSSIVLYIRTNNNTDRTEQILREWVARVGHLYAHVEFDAEDVEARVEQFGVHEWNATRFRVLGRIRNVSMRRALEHECDFYFVADVDNFVRPCTLRELMALDLPIVAPLLRSIGAGNFYSNYHAEIDANGYYKACDQYHWILNRWVRGVMEMPVVHCTYLIRADVLNDLTYEDGSNRFEYVVFSDSARKSRVPQYLDNRQVYGYITFAEGDGNHVVGGIEQARRLLDADLGATSSGERLASPPAAPRAETEARIRARFSEIYEMIEWGYGSGVGSLPANNTGYMEFVQSFIETRGINSVVDFGCGDWQFSRLMDWKGASYVGFDLVPSLIERNRKAFARPGVSFEVFRALDEVPAADLLLCKDVLQHLPNDTIREYLAAFKRKFKFLLITNDDQPDSLLNSDIQAGGWRPVRLDRPPFSERAPTILAWTVTSGGWKPTHKAACLINGHTALEKGDSHAVAGGIEQAGTLLDAEPRARAGTEDGDEVALALATSVDNRASLTPGYRDSRGEDNAEPVVSGTQGKRFIRLKEFPPSSEISNTPPDSYIAARDSSLIRRAYKITTDQDGFILPRSGGRTGGRKVVIIGDSVVESMFAEPEQRFCSKLEDFLCDELGLDVTVLNGGYGGATSLHSFNVFLNKLIPLRPAAVILMTGIVDADVAPLKASYWSHDCWVEPIVDTAATNTWRDNDKLPHSSFDDRTKMLTIFATASKLFDIPLWYATVPHRQVYSGEYARKAFANKADFDRRVDVRKQMNAATRKFATDAGIPHFDLELELAARSDIFYDMFHLNSLGGEAVARAFIKCGIGDLLKGQDGHKAALALATSVDNQTWRLPGYRGSRVEDAAKPVVSSPQGNTTRGESLAMLEQIHLINLDRSTDRLEEFKKRNAHLRNILRVPAIDGALVDREAFLKDGTITEDLPYPPGALGCALSHVGLWKKAVSENRVVTIFEDDVVCSGNFAEESERVVSSLPTHWDIVQWGFVFNPHFLWVDLGFAKAELRFYDRRVEGDYQKFQCESFSPAAVRLVHSFGLQAYSVSPKGARALLECCLPLTKRLIPFPGTGIVNTNTGIDTLMCAAYGSMQAFICIPPLVIHDDAQASERIARDRA
jgi:GR25 family glycosyltransferase involved in LPS biosynthesis/SAM-dependent methyltransferase/tetratricopeptide (TPR) repeat protein